MQNHDMNARTLVGGSARIDPVLSDTATPHHHLEIIQQEAADKTTITKLSFNGCQTFGTHPISNAHSLVHIPDGARAAVSKALRPRMDKESHAACQSVIEPE